MDPNEDRWFDTEEFIRYLEDGEDDAYFDDDIVFDDDYLPLDDDYADMDW